MDTSLLADRLLRYGAPVGLMITSLVHPTPGRDDAMAGLTDATTVWLTVHVVQLLVVAGLGATVRRMLDGVGSRPARVARAATIPFVAFYGAYDALVGLGSGILATRAAGATGAQEQAVLDAGDALLVHPIAILLAATGIVAWLVATIGAAAALRPREAASVPIGLVLAGVLVGASHVGAMGLGGACALLLAVHAQGQRDRWRDQDAEPATREPSTGSAQTGP